MRSSPSRSAPTITSPSRCGCASSWREWPPTCAGPVSRTPKPCEAGLSFVTSSSATASPTPDPPDSELAQRLDDKRSLRDARMRNDQVMKLYAVFAEQKDVEIYGTRSPSPRRLAPAFALDFFREQQQLMRPAVPLGLDHLIEKSRLVRDAPGLGFDDPALADDADSLLAQPSSRSAQIAGPRTEVGAEAEINPGHRMRSATRTARTICRTSWTRTMSAPRRTAPTTVAAVPSRRSATRRSSSLPLKALRVVATRIGWPISVSSEKRRM